MRRERLVASGFLPGGVTLHQMEPVFRHAPNGTVRAYTNALSTTAIHCFWVL